MLKLANDIILRPYQRKFIDDVRKQFCAGFKRVCGVAPCGAGKTVMTGWMIKEAIERGKRAIFFVHRKELIDQTAETFLKLNIPFDIVQGGDYVPNPAIPVYIASVQTLKNKLDWLTPPDLLICDECHHILSKTYLDIVNYWKDAYLLGVTATPLRLGGVRLGDVFEKLVLAPTVNELIELGNLSRFQYLAPAADVNFKGLRVRFGDYANKPLAEYMSQKNLVQGIVEKYKENIDGKSCICYCVNVNHSKLTAEAFKNAGIAAEHIDGDTPKNLRERIIKDFRAGRIKVLCNAELFGEGFDVPNMDAVILARPTKSLTLHIQQSMRAMRPDKNNPDKVAVIIDYVKNFIEHGLPDTNHNWSLKPDKDKEKGAPPYRICRKCGAVYLATAKFCPVCNTPAPIYEHELKVTENVGKLETFNNHLSIEFFLNQAKKRGFKPYWAVHQALKYVESKADVEHIAEVMNYKEGWVYYNWKEAEKIIKAEQMINSCTL